jgi:hypothetical protein
MKNTYITKCCLITNTLNTKVICLKLFYLPNIHSNTTKTMELLSCCQHTQHIVRSNVYIYYSIIFESWFHHQEDYINIKTYLHKMCDNIILKLIYTVDVQIVSVVPVGNYSLRVLNFINSVCVSSLHGV